MLRRFASLLIISLGLALAAPVLACAQLQQSHDCCPDKSPCGKCPPASMLDCAPLSCASMPASTASLSATTLRVDVIASAPAAVPAATEPFPPPRALHAATYPPPPETATGASGEPAWLVTGRLRL